MFAFIVEKGVVSRCLLRQEKESSCRVLDILPKKRDTQKASETTRSRNEEVKSASTQTFIVSRCLLRQEKELSCHVAFYAKKRSCRVALPFTPRKGVVVSRCLLRQEKESSCRVLDILPEKKDTQKASETTRSRNEEVKSSSTQTFIVSCPDVLPEKKNVQVVSITIRNWDETYSQPNPYPNT